MVVRKLGAAVASIALLSSAPVLAAPASSSAPSASRLSVVNHAGRVGAPVSSRSGKLGGGTGGLVAAAIGIGILAIAVFAVLDETDDDDSFPVSP